MGMKMAMMMVIGVLLVMVPKTMQLPVNHPLHRVVERINVDSEPFLALVLSTASDERALLDSGYYVPNQFIPSLNIAGRKFNIGRFKNVPVIYVIAESPLVYVSATIQILVDTFSIKGIVDYGSAATVSESVAIGDVAVLSAAAFTGVWNWEQWEKQEVKHGKLPSLRFGEFNYPEAGDNKLGSIHFQQIKHYTPGGISEKKDSFWFHVHDHWLQMASHLKDVALEKCDSDGNCLKKEPEVVVGVKGSSADTLLSNEAYGNFLNKNFGISTVDRKSAATISTAIANGVRQIVFRAATNRPGVEFDSKVSALCRQNLLKVVAAFIERMADKSPVVNSS